MRMIAVMLAAAGLSGCSLAGGDLMVRVTGTVPAEAVASGANPSCTLSGRPNATGQLRASTHGPMKFEGHFMVVVGREPVPVSFTATCDDGKRYTSRFVMVGAQKKHQGPFDLGVLKESE